jgi:Family of unknown function (DUF5996)
MSDNLPNDNDAWPDIHVAKWSGTKRSLYLYAQMLGKIRLALSPPQPSWTFTPLYLSPRGLETGFIPYGGTSVEAALDVFESRITRSPTTGAQANAIGQPSCDGFAQ